MNESREALPRDVLADLVRAAGRRPAPRTADYERVLAASRAAWQAKLRARRRLRWYALAAAAAVCAAVGLSMVLSTAPPPEIARAAIVEGRVEMRTEGMPDWTPVEAGESLTLGTRLRTVGDGRAALELGGGISLRAAAATEWTLRTVRRIELAAGTLYVDTGTGAASSGVEIATRHGVVRDVGTQFEVRSLSSGVRVRVREGIAELAPAGSTAARIATAAGEEVALDAGGRMERQPIAPDAAEWLWAQALAAPPPLDGRPAIEVLTFIARESGKRLEFADAAAELRARSTLLHGDSAGLLPLELLDVLAATTDGLEYTLGAATLTVSRAPRP